MSSKTIRGKLEKCFQNKHGFYSLKVNGAWHNCGKNNYSSIEDNIVEFQISENKKGYWDVSSDVEVVAAAPAERSSGGGGGKGNSTQVSIERQMSYKAGIDIVMKLIELDKLPVGAKGKSFDGTLGFIDVAAAHVYAGVSGDVAFHAEAEEDEQAPPSADFVPQEA